MNVEPLIRSHPRRFATFIGVGVINTAMDILAFTCLYAVVGLDVISSNVGAFLVAVTNSYVMNRLFTFRDRRPGKGETPKTFARFVMVAITAMAASTAIVYALSFVMHPVIGKLIATAASTVINYSGCYWFAFAHTRNAGIAQVSD